MDYLVTQIMDQVDENYRDWYDFVWNRTRGIRKVSCALQRSALNFRNGSGGPTAHLYISTHTHQSSSFLALTGHHPAAPVLPKHGVTDREVHALPYSLRSPPLRGAHVLFRRQDQQREHDKVPAEPQGDVPGPGHTPRLLPQRGRVSPVQRVAEAQRGRHPTVRRGRHSHKKKKTIATHT